MNIIHNNKNHMSGHCQTNFECDVALFFIDKAVLLTCVCDNVNNKKISIVCFEFTCLKWCPCRYY